MAFVGGNGEEHEFMITPTCPECGATLGVGVATMEARATRGGGASATVGIVFECPAGCDLSK